MGSLILCHEKKAKQSYEITRIHKKIYTIEELCYYISHNLYLIDETIVNKQLCDWIMEELGMDNLARDLSMCIRKNGSVEQFILLILKASAIYTEQEIRKIEELMKHLKNQKDVERKKCKADNLLESGEVEDAILVYLSIIHETWDEKLDHKFYGRVYACLGAAYGRMFLYEEASKMYEAAYQICEEECMVKAYLYCCRHYMSEEEYEELLLHNGMYGKLDFEIRESEQEILDHMDQIDAAKQFKLYKDNYRRVC